VDHLRNRRLLVFLGKGGVGKTTLTAAMGRLLVAQGKRVLLCEVNAGTDPSRSFGSRLPLALGLAGASGPEVREVSPDLFLCDLQPEAALREYALMKLRIEQLVKRLLGNRVVHAFLRMVPALSELVMLGKLLHHVREQKGGGPRFDAVLLDAPATGHGISLLRLPQVLLRNTPAGPLRDDLLWMNGLLVDPAVTAVHLVSLAEELPVNETLELNATLRDQLHLPRGACFVNGLWPSRFQPGELQLLKDRVSPAIFAAADRLEAQAELSRVQLARLRGQIDLPVLELPQLVGAIDSGQVTQDLQPYLEAQLAPAIGEPHRRAASP
jgi:energy-coupling factor transporter ATP-binding protein EcfA2